MNMAVIDRQSKLVTTSPGTRIPTAKECSTLKTGHYYNVCGAYQDKKSKNKPRAAELSICLGSVL